MKSVARTGLLFVALTVTLMAQDLHQAVEQGNPRQVEKIVSENPELLESRNEQNLTPLLLASIQGKKEMIELLLKMGADMEAGDNEGSNALHNAAAGGHLDILNLLLDRGTDVNGCDSQGMTALHFTCSREHLKCTRFLISREADVHVKEQSGRTPLFLAASRGSLELCRLLIDHGANVDSKDVNDVAPLHLAAMNGHRAMVALLLDEGAEAKTADQRGDTPVHYAAWQGARRTVELLLANGADLHSRNRRGKTPIDYAAQAGRQEIVQVMNGTKDQGLDLVPGKKIDEGDPGERRPVTLTVLYDNFQAAPGTRTEWGFSCLIEGMEKTILFDTGGEADVLQHNIRSLNAEVSGVDRIVISHNHWDHTGGLLSILEENPAPPVYAPQSFPFSFVRNVEEAGGNVVAVNEPVEICPHVYSTGEMGDRIKEQSLILNTSKGLVIVTGCSHQGIAEIVKKARRLFDKEILLVFGGFHLMRHSDEQVARIIDDFRECGVRKCGATHCTGEHQIELFRQAYGDDYIPIGTGRQIIVSSEGIETSP